MNGKPPTVVVGVAFSKGVVLAYRTSMETVVQAGIVHGFMQKRLCQFPSYRVRVVICCEIMVTQIDALSHDRVRVIFDPVTTNAVYLEFVVRVFVDHLLEMFLQHPPTKILEGVVPKILCKPVLQRNLLGVEIVVPGLVSLWVRIFSGSMKPCDFVELRKFVSVV